MINLTNPDYQNTPVYLERRHFGYELLKYGLGPVVTIVTPFYNTGEVFYQTAQSVLQQSLQQFEWLIINDGSDDPQSLQILDQYRQKDPRIRIIDHAENRGLSAARNTGFRHAQTEYVSLLDSDDLLEPTAVEKWWWFLQTQPQFGFVASYHVAFERQNYLWTGGFHDGAQNAERNRVSMMCMIRKSVHQAVGGFDETIRGGLEDWDFWMRCAARGIWGATVPEFLAWYRLRSDHTDRWQNLQEERITEFRRRFQKQFPHLYHGQFPDPPLRDFSLDLILPSLDIPQVNQLVKSNHRLLFILPWLVMGGAERFALNLIDQLQKEDWQVTIVATAPAEHVWLEDFTKRTEDVFILPHFIPVKDYPRFLGYLIQSRQYDAVLIQGSHEGYRLLPVLRQLYPTLPFIDYLHFITPDWMQGGFPRLSVLYKDYLGRTITSSHQLLNWMVEEGVERQKLEVCYIGVDDQTWKPDQNARRQVRSELGVGIDEIVLFYAARLEEQKQPFLMLEAVKRLSECGKDFRLWVAGDGSLRPAIEQNIKQANLEKKVVLLGNVPTEKMPFYMAGADILFLPSQNEGISQAIYEAMACGLVVVGAKVGGQAELVTPDCGFLVEVREEQTQIEEYQRILGNLLENPEQREIMGQRARQRIQNQFTLDVMGNCMLAVLESVMSKDDVMSEPGPITPELVEKNRTIVEFLQARQEGLRLYRVVEEISNQYSELYKKFVELTSPKPPSYWFYLWLRQLLLPVYIRLSNNKHIGYAITSIKMLFKKIILRR
ncbi:MAG: glycosyltransferase [Chloroflexota bacterium]